MCLTSTKYRSYHASINPIPILVLVILSIFAHLYCKRRKWSTGTSIVGNIRHPYKRLSGYKAEMRGSRAERTENRLELTLIPSLTTTPGPN